MKNLNLPMRYRLTILAIVLFALLGPRISPLTLAAAPERRPNVILFLVDDMGWTDCGAYGSRYYETPNIDRLAQNGIRFTDAYSANPLCTPTRASILTGQYPARLGITSAVGAQPPQPADAPRYPENAGKNRRLISPESLRYLPPEKYTLAEALHDAGYRTGHFGKWHLGLTEPYWPERQGYDVAWHGAPDPGPPGPNGYFSPYGFTAGTIKSGPDGEYIVDRLTDEVLQFIGTPSAQPFFAAVWQFGVHGPWGHKQEYTNEFAKKVPSEGHHHNPVMASMLKSIDESLGRIVARVNELGIAENTVILFTSDNGGNVHSNTEEDQKPRAAGNRARAQLLENYHRFAGNEPPTNNYPLRSGKGTLYEGGVRIPLIVSWPGVIPAGKTSSEIVCSIDYYPTLIDLIGAPLKSDANVKFDGVSFAPTLRNASAKVARDSLFNFFPHGGPKKPPGVTVRQGDWKLIRWFEPTPDANEVLCLYNLKDDIGESRNQAAAQPELVEKLNREIDRFLQETGALVPKPNPNYSTASAEAE